jgi:hypothetical protein
MGEIIYGELLNKHLYEYGNIMSLQITTKNHCIQPNSLGNQDRNFKSGKVHAKLNAIYNDLVIMTPILHL